MMDVIGRRIFMTPFRAAMKAFYVKRVAEDRTHTESVDLVMRVVGDRRRVDADRRRADVVDKANKRDPTPYYWYMDQRTYGTFQQGGLASGQIAVPCGSCGRTTSATSASTNPTSTAASRHNVFSGKSLNTAVC